MSDQLNIAALRALLKLMKDRTPFDDGMESIIAAMPSLLSAADERDALRAENARLREALDIAEHSMTKMRPHCPADLVALWSLDARLTTIRALLSTPEGGSK